LTLLKNGVIDLSDYFKQRHEIEECPIYDILLGRQPYDYLHLDTKESFSDTAIIRGLGRRFLGGRGLLCRLAEKLFAIGLK